MKITISCFLIFISITSFTQEIDYFADNPEWRQTSVCAVPYPCVQTDQYVYYVNGDSIVDGITYKQIFRRGIFAQNWMSPPPAIECGASDEFDDFYLLLRQEEKQMYIRAFDSGMDILLYDFDLNVGDALPMSYNNYTSDILIDSIDSLLVGDVYRKRFHFQGLWASSIIEGIGSDLGLFEPMGAIFECGHNLDCFALDETTYYPELDAECELNVSVNEIENQINVSFFPNPVKDKVNFSFSNPVHSLKAQLFTIDGKRCESILIENSPSTYSISMDHLNTGLYLIRLVDDEAQISEFKILKE